MRSVNGSFFTQVIRPYPYLPQIFSSAHLDAHALGPHRSGALSQLYLAPSRIGEYTAFFGARVRDWEARWFLGISGIDVLQIGYEI